MKSLFLLANFFFGNQYEEVDGALVYLRTETVIVDDEVKVDRIITMRQGRKAWTWELLVVDSDKEGITLEIHN